ncbi:unnamed protein product [Polarella glacialis]|uniref:DRBM domain-containing protein n=1 Tax=Polarella glacialis TaxID=89957 RepID=A0A813HP50_POLGL|nr:unnamed protein product [Polarella glacialis]
MKRSTRQAQSTAAATVSNFPKEALYHTAQKSGRRGLVEGDVVYTMVDTGSGYVATCSFSAELSSTMGIHQGINGAVAENKKAAEHNAASAVLSVLGVESGPTQNKGSTKAPTQSP